ncbi:DUF2845 domain-containing protein [Vibrio ordalii]|uniref:DUF2845 domain-containing protein n=1 Tax=Vibrio ordalii TaxID=28174 RepID=UPI002574A90E|nr:DUF2845 domain-containing protein [Vibrio ordalii]MCS0352720.1 DUF2845 domain-containing protein [Vibrio ordalii]
MCKLLTLAFSFLIWGCATVPVAFNEINAGDSKSDVIAKVGAPENRQFSGKNEAFQYCTTGTSFGVSTYNVIWFFDSKVTGANSYSLSRAGSCSGHFKTLNWEDAPDTIIELRDR